MPLTPVDHFTSFIHFHDDGQVHADPQEFDFEQEGWMLTTFHMETDADVHADHWEIHPEADEIVSCLTGGVRLYLRPGQPGDEEEEVQLGPGTTAIVPRGRWHRLAVDAPSDIMSFTLLCGSRLERRTEAH